MARKKEYIESEVVEKAMYLFWKNGFETTSMQMLEKEMGINKFSIYSSFGSKNGLFIESLKCYKQKLKVITDQLAKSNNGILGIKEYFYNFLQFSKDNKELMKGCLITNTANELNDDANPQILNELQNFTNYIRGLFENNLKQVPNLNEENIQEKADYYIVSMFGLSSASRVFNQSQLNIFIENIFKTI